MPYRRLPHEQALRRLRPRAGVAMESTRTPSITSERESSLTQDAAFFSVLAAAQDQAQAMLRLQRQRAIHRNRANGGGGCRAARQELTTRRFSSTFRRAFGELRGGHRSIRLFNVSVSAALKTSIAAPQSPRGTDDINGGARLLSGYGRRSRRFWLYMLERRSEEAQQMTSNTMATATRARERVEVPSSRGRSCVAVSAREEPHKSLSRRRSFVRIMFSCGKASSACCGGGGTARSDSALISVVRTNETTLSFRATTARLTAAICSSLNTSANLRGNGRWYRRLIENWRYNPGGRPRCAIRQHVVKPRDVGAVAHREKSVVARCQEKEHPMATRRSAQKSV